MRRYLTLIKKKMTVLNRREGGRGGVGEERREGEGRGGEGKGDKIAQQ